MPLPRPAAGEGRAAEGRAAEGLSSTVTSAGALWLEPSSRRSFAVHDFVMDDEVVLAERDQPFVLHPSELPGQGRPVDVQIVGQLLAVERDIELRAAYLYGDGVQVGEKPGADGSGRGMKAPLRQDKVLVRRDDEEVGRQPVPGAVSSDQSRFSID